MPQHQQVCAITTKTVYELTLAADGRIWGELAESGVWFAARPVRPLSMAIEKNEQYGIATYLDRVH